MRKEIVKETAILMYAEEVNNLLVCLKYLRHRFVNHPESGIRKHPPVLLGEWIDEAIGVLAGANK